MLVVLKWNCKKVLCRTIAIIVNIFVLTMTRFWTFIVSLCLSCLAVACADNSLGVDSRTDSLLSVYDRMVDHAADYIALRQSSIDSLRQNHSPLTINHSPLTILRLAELYVPYRSDSALHYYNLAIASDDEQVASRAAIRRIRLLASIGDFDAAFRERKKVQDVAPSNRVIYYDAMYRLYSEAAMSAKLQNYSDEFWAQAHAYADSLIAYCDANALRPSEYWRQRISQANSRRDFYTALACTDSALMSLTPEQHEYAIFAFERAVIYRDMGPNPCELTSSGYTLRQSPAFACYTPHSPFRPWHTRYE